MPALDRYQNRKNHQIVLKPQCSFANDTSLDLIIGIESQ